MAKVGQSEGGGLMDSSGPGLLSQLNLFSRNLISCLETEYGLQEGLDLIHFCRPST